MYTICENKETRIEIKKSIFIANLIKVTSIEEVNDTLKAIRKKYYDATHNCYSYILGKDGTTYKYSDDGEPSQTAGIIIYNALAKNNLTDVICIVTRYFGGIKLGAGGLVRAYSASASEVIASCLREEIIEYQELFICFDYSYTTQVLKLLAGENKTYQAYEEKVKLKYLIPITKIDEYKEQLISLTNGSVIID